MHALKLVFKRHETYVYLFNKSPFGPWYDETGVPVCSEKLLCKCDLLQLTLKNLL